MSYTIDDERRLVVARGSGVLRGSEVLAYSEDVWSRPECSDYAAIVDLRAVEDISFGSVDDMRHVADRAAASDPPEAGAPLAIVADASYLFGVSRMYQSYREMSARTTRPVQVFRSCEEAHAWVTATRVTGESSE